MAVKCHFFLFMVYCVLAVTALVSRPASALESLPEIYFYDKLNRRVTLHDFKGEAVLVNLWATWCPPCIAELPVLAALQETFSEKKFRVIALSLDTLPPEEIEVFFKKNKAESLAVYHDKDHQVPLKWSYKGLPTSYLLDAEGKLIARYEGPREWAADKAVLDAIRASLPQ